jgi:hypothetical protein
MSALSPRRLFISSAVALLAACVSLFAPSFASAASPGFIEGTVTDAVTHQPLEKINVCAYATGGGSSCALTDPGGSGEYIIAVDPGEYRIGFSSIEHIYLTQFYNGKETEEEGDIVSVTDGATTSSIDAAMQEGGRISGTVTAANGGGRSKGSMPAPAKPAEQNRLSPADRRTLAANTRSPNSPEALTKSNSLPASALNVDRRHTSPSSTTASKLWPKRIPCP